MQQSIFRFRKRLAKRESPLPNLANCTRGSSYYIGYIPFEDCRAGYCPSDIFSDDHFDVRTGNIAGRTCVNPQSCRPVGREGEFRRNDQYKAVRHAKPNYIDMEINGVKLPRAYYSTP